MRSTITLRETSSFHFPTNGSPAVEQACADDDEQARSALHALDEAITAYDGRLYHRASRRFHLALIRPCRMRRLAWAVNEH